MSSQDRAVDSIARSSNTGSQQRSDSSQQRSIDSPTDGSIDTDKINASEFDFAVGTLDPVIRERPGLKIERTFTKAHQHPFDQVKWELRTASITDATGKVFFEQKDVEFPVFWSQQATNIVVQKYFRGKLGTPQREQTLRAMISRVVDTIAMWGYEQGYFDSEDSYEAFKDELTYMILHQHMAFNSPVWFNIGVQGSKPQASACYINSVEDSMDSILTLAKTEGMLFKYGSGTGTNLSALRSSKESLAGGGTSSGPISFMRGFDAFAGAIKSGGTTRRAAKIVILNVDHPDIVDFIDCKAIEEKKAHALIDAGYDGGFNVANGAYDSIGFQNANHSVRVTDKFMQAVLDDHGWSTKAVLDGKTVETLRARDLLNKMAQAAWSCGDPGIQFDSITNEFHTCSNTGRINAANPCAEFVFLDDTACNLASLNLMKFRLSNGAFDVNRFKHAVRLSILAQEILVDNASYPTDRIAKNSHAYRPLGLGYSNLGSLLMVNGLPYDSVPGQAYAAAVTALMAGEAYAQSAMIARDSTGPFPGYEVNTEPMLGVIQKHCNALRQIDSSAPVQIVDAAKDSWGAALLLGRKHGFRNAQATLLAPTGTIAFMMDCDTTGVEPELALVKYKRLVGGGSIKMVNHTVEAALIKLGYDAIDRRLILDHIDKQGTIEDTKQLKPEHLSIFDCAFQPSNGQRSIHYMGHVRMMAAVQPFLSGAISKTVNMPSNATVEEIEQVYGDAWRMGLKSITVYRDGCKRTQPLETKAPVVPTKAPPTGRRHRLPTTRTSITHKFSIAGHEGYVTVGLYETGQPGEVFVRMAKEGSTVSGLMDAFGTAVSIALQHGVPLASLVDKFKGTRFEPAGFTGNPEVPSATSITDYLFRWLSHQFAPANVVEATASTKPTSIAAPTMIEATDWIQASDAPLCHSCGTLMVRNGACHRCNNCGETSGCS